jgi:hypothetical protein
VILTQPPKRLCFRELGLEGSLDNFLQLENRHNNETLRMRRVRDAGGQAVLTIDGSLPPRMSGPPLHVHFLQRKEIVVKAGSLGARVGNERSLCLKPSYVASLKGLLKLGITSFFEASTSIDDEPVGAGGDGKPVAGGRQLL